MITHVIVELKYPVEDEYFHMDTVFPNEYYGYGTPLIRCRDCKYWMPHTQFGYDADYDEYHNYCKRHLPDDDFYAFIKEADDFCSWAERKEE